MENYICINGKKAELTEEQMKALGIELPKKNPFERVVNNANTFYNYYFISSTGNVDETYDGGFCNGNGTDDLRFRIANYCTNKAILEQRALYETLSRLLWRYSMEHDGDKIQLNHSWGLGYSKGVFEEYELFGHVFGECVFYSKEIAKAAIKEIVEPFMKAHPEFKL